MLVVRDDDEYVRRPLGNGLGYWRVREPTNDGGSDEHGEHERASQGCLRGTVPLMVHPLGIFGSSPGPGCFCPARLELTRALMTPRLMGAVIEICRNRGAILLHPFAGHPYGRYRPEEPHLEHVAGRRAPAELNTPRDSTPGASDCVPQMRP